MFFEIHCMAFLLFKNKGISQYFKLFLIILGSGIVLASTLITNRLAGNLAKEEQKKIEIWAEATRQFVLADDNTNLDFILKILEENSTIPVIVVDQNDVLIHSRNVKEPLNNTNEFYVREIKRLKAKNTSIKVDLGNTYQNIYYDDSRQLKQLYYYPYIQLGVIAIFILIAYFAFSSTKKAEQNRVWVGLSKETAHQLGTPISSLLAWVDLLLVRHQDDKMIVEMAKDVNRLRTIAERFSKIGSVPDLKLVSLNETLNNAIHYISNRTSRKVEIKAHYDSENHFFVNLNVHLFEWVIENLCKNAIDAMDGTGSIDIYVSSDAGGVVIDVKDTGKGIEKSNFKTVFSPGYTTKARGWGLGLSLVKRIIEEYHKGRIFVKNSEKNVGTTFRIILKA